MKTDTFDPDSYNVYHLGISGGKDSTATLLWLVFLSGWPLGKLIVTFCDTGNEDRLTYAFIEMLKCSVFDVFTIRPKRNFWQLARHKKRFPGHKSRFCTQHLKVIPSMLFVYRLKKLFGNVLLLSGIRADEGKPSNQRGEMGEFSYSDTYGCDLFLPIYNYSLNDVWNIHKRFLSLSQVRSLIESDGHLSDEHKRGVIGRMMEHGIPRNPLYDMGANRVGCYPCIFSRKQEIRSMSQYRPERIDFIREQEGAFSNPNMYSTFFPIKTVPERFRSQPIITKNGREMNVPTIDDVVTWSKTSWGAKQFLLPLVESVQNCDYRGHCE